MKATTADLLSQDVRADVDRMNEWLKKNFGYFNDQATWRIVWSEDQFEMRKGTFNYFDDNGTFLRTEVGIQNVPKYRQWIKEKYVLERIMPVPEINRDELITKLSYEPVFVFDNDKGEALYPRLDVAQLVIEAICRQAAKTVGAKYKDPMADPKIAPEVRKAHIDGIVKELFPNETETGDALHYKDAMVSSGTESQIKPESDGKTVVH